MNCASCCGNMKLNLMNVMCGIEAQSRWRWILSPITHGCSCLVTRLEDSIPLGLKYRTANVNENSNGRAYAAATGCRCVVSAGKVSTVLKSERPWNPTGVALREGDVYVLVWTHANGGANDGWRPRVRKVTRDGTVSLLVEIKEEVNR